MPNHVTHTVTVRGDCAAVHALTFAANEEGQVWFDLSKLIPMPACLKDTTAGSDSSLGLALIGHKGGIGSFFHTNPDEARRRFDAMTEERKGHVIADTFKSVEALIRTGSPDWYEWSTANWGTKWNAYAQDSIPEVPADLREWEFAFDTAWSSPEPVFEALAALLPEGTTIEVEWEDEGGPRGRYMLTTGSVESEALADREYDDEDD